MLRKIYLFFVFLLFLAVSPLSMADEQSAKQVVEEFQNQLIAVMKQGKTLGFKGRYEKLDGAVRSSHDLAKIARIVVSKQWEELSAEQQAKLEAVFSKLSVFCLCT